MFKLVLVACLLLAAPAAVAQSLKPRDVLADGTRDIFWVARVGPATLGRAGEQTTIYVRRGNGDPWAVLLRQPIPTRAVSLTSRENELAVLLDNGQWMLVYPDGTEYSTAALPSGSMMVAGDAEKLPVRNAAGGTSACPPNEPATCLPDSQLKKKNVLSLPW